MATIDSYGLVTREFTVDTSGRSGSVRREVRTDTIWISRFNYQEVYDRHDREASLPWLVVVKLG